MVGSAKSLTAAGRPPANGCTARITGGGALAYHGDDHARPASVAVADPSEQEPPKRPNQEGAAVPNPHLRTHHAHGYGRSR